MLLPQVEPVPFGTGNLADDFPRSTAVASSPVIVVSSGEPAADVYKFCDQFPPSLGSAALASFFGYSSLFVCKCSTE
ncbi:hypothetical protein Y032_0499g2549 [Ancylostoma ceylanicum]|uniref:Uncharacterized protein n=1 Tax=Ancylostoma ceylanicum TaxID=53326 RepID=A0A016WW23_9BILA|nr:hypothetical protein Y032_0499g2549 [Ancylostoma ceylanicum]